MNEKEMKTRRWPRRLLAATAGIAAGALLYAAFAQGVPPSLREPVGRVVTVLPLDLRERGEALLGPAGEAENPLALVASGVVRANQVQVASELGGRVVTVTVSEGDKVRAGQLLVQFDTRLLDARIAAAETLVAVAQAALDQALTGVRPGQIAVAEAKLAQAEVARTAAQVVVSDTVALVENPQELRLQVAVAYMQAEAARYRTSEAEALKDALEIAQDEFYALRDQWEWARPQKVLIASGSIDDLIGVLPPDFLERLPGYVDGVYTYDDYELVIDHGTFQLYRWIKVNLPLEFHLAPNQWWQAWAGVNAARAVEQGTQTALYYLAAQRDHPQSLEAQADSALGALAQATAAVQVAQALVDGLEAGATPEQIAALEAQRAQAQVAVLALETQRSMLSIVAPLDGTVVSLVTHPGEVAAPGATLLTVADLKQLTLVVFVPENRLGTVALGQRVLILVGSIPGKEFAGTVERVADAAEFTPRNVTTLEERVNLVFAVHIRVENGDRQLKPGMPADARFPAGGER